MDLRAVYRRLVETRETATDRVAFRQTACEAIADVLGWPVWIGIADAHAGCLEVHASARPARGPLPQTTVGIDPTRAGPTTRVADSGTVQVVPEIGENPEYRRLRGAFEADCRSSVSVPLEAGGVSDGVLHLYATEPIAEGAHDDFEPIGTVLAQGLRAFETAETLTHQRRRLERVRTTVSHDLRNPLNIGQGRLGIVRSECDHPDLEHVDYGFDRLDALVAEILTFVRAGEPVETARPLSLQAVCRECWKRIETGTASLAVAGDRTIHADPERVYTLFEELYANALEHGSTGRSEPDGSKDAVDGGGDDEQLTVRVGPLADGRGFFLEDTGRGIPDDEREYALDWGYATAGGDGHGLAIVDEIARAHGWDVRLSEGGRGGLRVVVRTT